MGTALDNIDELLQMSSGCGEQNMVHFAPNVFITRYLEETGQLTPEIKQKAIGYLESGEWISACHAGDVHYSTGVEGASAEAWC